MKRGIEIIEKPHLKSEIPPFRVGDEVRVFQRIQEGDKSRLQAFDGIVIRRRGIGTGATFTVLRADRSDSVEKNFALHSKLVEKIVVTKPAKTKLTKAKLYSLRHKSTDVK